MKVAHVVMAAILVLGGGLNASATAQTIPLQEIQEFKRTRHEPAGGIRLAAVEGLVAHPHRRNFPLFFLALEQNGRAMVQTAERIDRQQDSARRLAEQLVDLGDRAAPARREKLETELQQAQGDLNYRRQQMIEIRRECAALRKGLVASWKTLEGDESTLRLQEVMGLLKRSRHWPLRRELVLLAAEFPVPEVAAVLAELLAKDRDAVVRAACARALGREEMAGAESGLLPALDDPHDLVRSAVLRGLRKVGGAASVEALIDHLGKERGRLLEEHIIVLRHLAGVNYFDNETLWREWWAKEKPRYQPPGERRSARRRDAPEPEADPEAPGFYGLRARSEAIVYLIDVSGSMAEPALAEGTTGAGPRDETKLDRAKRELIRSISGLPVGISINIVAYGDELETYANQMVVLRGDRRPAITAWIKSLQARGRTNLYDALEWVLDLARGRSRAIPKEMIVDTIYLLTDGHPTAGRITDSRHLAAEVERLNELTGVVIHTVGVGRNHDSWLLKQLSETSNGIYIRAR